MESEGKMEPEVANRKSQTVNRLSRAFLPLLLSVLLVWLYGVPDGSLAGICKELLAETTEGRQALVGSCWHAPLPTLLYLPFAWLLPAAWAAKTAGFCLWYFYIVTISAMLTGSLAWCFSGKTNYLVQTAVTAALLLLCGVLFLVPAAVVLLLLPVGALFHAETRKRIPAWLLLGWIPSLYTIGIWLLMNSLILNDSLFFLRSLRKDTLTRVWLERSLPPKPSFPADRLLHEVADFVNDRTEYGRVFVLGYRGLALLENNTDQIFLPNLDLRIGSLRRAYKGQNLYLLVPQPSRLAAMENAFWRFPELYVRGAERLLYAKDFGTWRLFEVIQAPTKEQLQEWGKRSS